VPRKYRVCSTEFKKGAVQRMLKGESVSALHRSLDVTRSMLYRWRATYRQEGMAGLSRPQGRPSRSATAGPASASAEDAAAGRIAELERKIGQQEMDLAFFRRAFKPVRESRRNNAVTGGTASIERSGQ
jgi:transposase